MSLNTINWETELYPTKEQLEKEFGKLESYEFIASSGKRLKVWFHRQYISDKFPSMMSVAQAWTVEEVKEKRNLLNGRRQI